MGFCISSNVPLLLTSCNGFNKYTVCQIYFRTYGKVDNKPVNLPSSATLRKKRVQESYKNTIEVTKYFLR